MKICRITSLLAFGLLGACDSPESSGRSTGPPGNPEAAAQYVGFSFTSASYSEADYTSWMSRAELQHVQDHTPSHQYFARVEGREHQGRMEFRAAVKPFAAARYEQWAVFWGIGDDELFEWELKLLRAGFERSEMQTFKDSMGRSLNQIVWLLPVGASPEDPDLVAEHEPETAERPPMASRPASVDSSIQAPPTSPSSEPAETRLSADRAPSSNEVSPSDASQAPPLSSPSPGTAASASAASSAPVREPEKPVETLPATDSSGHDSGIPAAEIVHLVQPGDTLSKIARRNGLTVQRLKKANNLRSDLLRVGQKITIPKTEKKS